MRRPLKRLGLALLAAGGAFAAWRVAERILPPAKLVPGRETTFLVAPLRGDGTVDYAAAIEEERGAGITPADNAAPALAAALGRSLDGFTDEELAEAPAAPRVFVDWCKWLEARRNPSDHRFEGGNERFRAAISALESGESDGVDLALFREWLAEQGGALDAAASVAARRCLHRRHSASGAPESLLLRERLAEGIRELVVALDWRALLRAADGDSVGACDDLVDAAGLARLAADPGFPVDLMWAANAAVHVVTSARRVAELRLLRIDGFRRLVEAGDRTALPDRVRATFRLARIENLDAITLLHRGRAGVLCDDALRRSESASGGAEREFRGLDPDRFFRRTNEWWDRIDGALLTTVPWSERLQLLDEVVEGAKSGRARGGSRFLLLLASRERRSIAAADGVAGVLLGATRAVVEAVLRAAVEVDLVLAELAALLFADENVHDPATTDDLAPAIFASPFRDRVTGSPLSFRRDEQGELRADGPARDLLRELDRREEEKRRP